MKAPARSLAIVALAVLAGAAASCSDNDGESPAGGGTGSVGLLENGGGFDGLDEREPPPVPDGPAVTAVVETEPVDSFGDAADDPAIWVNPEDPSKSLVIGTDKTRGGGLNVYNLDGSLRQFVEVGEVNNVDLRPGFSLGGEEVTLIAATNRTTDSLALFTLDAKTLEVRDVAAREIATAEQNYGLCMYRSPAGEHFAFVTTEPGKIQQFRLFEADGGVDAEVVREFCLPTQPEGCVADDELGSLFVGEEAVGVWKFAADVSGEAPGEETPECEGAATGMLVDNALDGNLKRDVEGMAIAYLEDGQGYLIVSSQGAHEYAVYDRAAPHAYQFSFTVWGGGPSCIDGTEETDGLDVTATPLGDAFPGGLFVAQDGSNNDPVATQNFKLVRFDDIVAQRFEPNAECRISDYGGKPNSRNKPPGPERTEAFCEAFCAKCEACYAEGDPSFSESDCHYLTSKPDYDPTDCAEGCAAGFVPADTQPLQPGWEEWECSAFDDGL